MERLFLSFHFDKNNRKKQLFFPEPQPKSFKKFSFIFHIRRFDRNAVYFGSVSCSIILSSTLFDLLLAKASGILYSLNILNYLSEEDRRRFGVLSSCTSRYFCSEIAVNECVVYFSNSFVSLRYD